MSLPTGAFKRCASPLLIVSKGEKKKTSLPTGAFKRCVSPLLIVSKGGEKKKTSLRYICVPRGRRNGRLRNLHLFFGDKHNRLAENTPILRRADSSSVSPITSIIAKTPAKLTQKRIKNNNIHHYKSLTAEKCNVDRGGIRTHESFDSRVSNNGLVSKRETLLKSAALKPLGHSAENGTSRVTTSS